MSTTNLVGKLLDRRYRPVRVLAAGGFGHTYLAEDTRRPNNPLCVVKHLVCPNQSQEMAELAVKMFHREAEVLERLTAHPQIPQLLAYFEEEGEFYIVQQYIQGHSLSQELQSKENWAESKVRAFLGQLLPILSFIHSQGVIHRDIKPSNILRQKSDGKLFLIDFGAIKQLQAPNVPSHALTSATISIGTPGYMPIEQGMGKPRPSSDIFGLGMTAIHGATTIHPQNLKEDEDGELIWKPFAQHLSPDLLNFLERMVRSHFKERYKDGSEALIAFQQLPALDLPETALQDITAPQILVAGSAYHYQTAPSINLPPAEVRTSPQEITMLHLDTAPALMEVENSPVAEVGQPISLPALTTEPDAPMPFIEKVHQTSIAENRSEHLQAIANGTTLPPEPHISETPVSPLSSPQAPAKLELANATTLLNPEPQKNSAPRLGRTILALGSLILVGGGVWGWGQWQNRTEAEALLTELRTLQSSGDHDTCLQKSNLLLPKLSSWQIEIQAIQQSCLAGKEQSSLTNAQKLLEQQKFAEAIAIAQSIPSNSPNQPSAQKIINQAAERIVSQINRNIQAKGDIARVEELVKILPATYKNRTKVAQSVRNYRRLWDKNKATVNQINQAFKAQKWDEVIELYQSLSIPDMQKQVKWTSDRAQREIASRRIAPVLPRTPDTPSVPSSPVDTYVPPPPPAYNPPPVYTPPSGGDDRPPPVYAD